MNRAHNPETIAPPYKNIYSHAIEVSGDARTLYLSGSLGVARDGTVPEGIERQSELVMENMAAVLASAGMGFGDLVKMNAFVLKVEYVPVFAAVRARHLAGARPAMTTVVVPALAAPGWLIEVDAVAARAGQIQGR
ncbi:MAG TPA: RidA family protein [Steroidobacteraceae bacterium]|nr:RidA family protein [Steroidobacteraceae bacterium]